MVTKYLLWLKKKETEACARGSKRSVDERGRVLPQAYAFWERSKF